MASSRILDLSQVISQGASKIHEHLRLHGLPHPSFEPGAPDALPQALSKSRDAVLDATIELQELLMGDVMGIHTHGNAQRLVSLNAVQKFDFPNCLPLEQKATFGELAARTGLSEPITKSLLRHAMTMRIFCEPEKGSVAHTSRSALLRQPKYRNFLRVGMEEMTPAALQTINAVSKWPLSEEPTQTGFCLANQTDQPMYTTLEQNPERAKRFADTMSIFTSGHGFEVDHVLDGFQWSMQAPATVIDLGGSNGHVAVALASRFPLLKVIIQDLEGAFTTADPIPEALSARVKFMPHDFFQPQPVVADIYFFRWILHNWSDKYCVRILQALIPALRPGAHILINDTCMPEPGTIPFWRERSLRTLELDMISILNGRERDADDWKSLLKNADPRFHLLHIKQPAGSNLAMISVIWRG